MGLFSFLSSKVPVSGRLVPSAPLPSVNLAVTVSFLSSSAGSGPPAIVGDGDPGDAAEARATLLVADGRDFEVELPAGHYQVVVRTRCFSVRGDTMVADEAFEDEWPLARAFEVRKGGPVLSLKVGLPFTTAGLRLCWPTDGRVNSAAARAPGDVETRMARLPRPARDAYQAAITAGNAGQPAAALAAYEQALAALPAEGASAVPELLLELCTGRAKCLLSLQREAEASALLLSHFGPGEILGPMALFVAVDTAGCFAESFAAVGDVEQAERFSNLALREALEHPEDGRLIGVAQKYRRRVLGLLPGRVPAERVLGLLEKQETLLGPPEQDHLGALARIELLGSLGKLVAARTIGQAALADARRNGPQGSVEVLERALHSLPDGPGTDPSPTYKSPTYTDRRDELAAAETLLEAARRGNLPALEAAARTRFGLEAAGKGWLTALIVAVQSRQPATVRWLLERGAKLEATDSTSRTPLLHACAVGASELVTLLVERGASLAARDGNLRSALHLAAAGNHAPLVTLLAPQTALLEARDEDGLTPLHLAASAKAGAQATLALLAAGADANAASTDGSTPLMLAALHGTLDSVRALRTRGADPTRRNRRRKTAKELALQGLRTELLDSL